jgi:hypothetical protein
MEGCNHARLLEGMRCELCHYSNLGSPPHMTVIAGRASLAAMSGKLGFLLLVAVLGGEKVLAQGKFRVNVASGVGRLW